LLLLLLLLLGFCCCCSYLVAVGGRSVYVAFMGTKQVITCALMIGLDRYMLAGQAVLCTHACIHA
jgi:hypothetical protein